MKFGASRMPDGSHKDTDAARYGTRSWVLLTAPHAKDCSKIATLVRLSYA